MMRRGTKSAVALALSLWRWLRDNPDARSKSDWPEYSKIEKMVFRCPLCDLYVTPDRKCPGCPLISCASPGDPYDDWCAAGVHKDPDDARKRAAQKIVARLEAWQREHKCDRKRKV